MSNIRYQSIMNAIHLLNDEETSLYKKKCLAFDELKLCLQNEIMSSLKDIVWIPLFIKQCSDYDDEGEYKYVKLCLLSSVAPIFIKKYREYFSYCELDLQSYNCKAFFMEYTDELSLELDLTEMDKYRETLSLKIEEEFFQSTKEYEMYQQYKHLFIGK